MPISAEPADAPVTRTAGLAARDAGFSLLEVLVAVALMASALSVAGVAIGPLIDRRERAAETRLVETFVRDARFEALAGRRVIDLSAHAGAFIAVADAQSFSVDTAVRVYPNGQCEAGAIRVRTEKRVLDFSMEEQTCRIIPRG